MCDKGVWFCWYTVSQCFITTSMFKIYVIWRWLLVIIKMRIGIIKIIRIAYELIIFDSVVIIRCCTDIIFGSAGVSGALYFLPAEPIMPGYSFLGDVFTSWLFWHNRSKCLSMSAHSKRPSFSSNLIVVPVIEYIWMFPYHTCNIEQLKNTIKCLFNVSLA